MCGINWFWVSFHVCFVISARTLHFLSPQKASPLRPVDVSDQPIPLTISSHEKTPGEAILQSANLQIRQIL